MTPAASIRTLSAPPTPTYPPLLPNDDVLHPNNTQMIYNTRASTQASVSYQSSSSYSMISDATYLQDNGVRVIGSTRDKNNISQHSYHQAPVQAPPSIPLQWLIIVPPTTYNVLPLPPPGYILWVPISQPPGLTFFKPSDTGPKEGGDIEASPIPNDWNNRTAIQREHWVEMTIFQKIPIIRKKHSRWRCGLKKCKWATKGNLWPTIASEYLVHQFEAHECWWSRTDEGRIHLNRLKRSLSF